MNDEKLFSIEPYAMDIFEKDKFFKPLINELTHFHRKNSEIYEKILNFYGVSDKEMNISDLPYLPVRIFKEIDLRTAGENDIYKTMKSSGTSGKQSKIFLDRETAVRQQKVLTKIMSSFLPSLRLPMIFLDAEKVMKDRNYNSARKAGLIGFSMFGRERFFAFDDDMNLKVEETGEFLKKHEGETVFAFGYTYMVWEYFVETLRKSGNFLDFSNVFLLHGGGWKKLQHLNISKNEFKEALYEVSKLKSVHEYYGMVEQTGSIFPECECGHLHVSEYSEIFTRRGEDFSLCDFGEEGIIQLLSLLPTSYPGHNILTEDTGVILGEDDCPCGRKGKYFEVTGRLKDAEVRGCSDTYA